jgi:signal transduction histidine kinase
VRVTDLRPDRLPVRTAGWVAIDVVLALFLTYLTVTSMTHDSWVQQYDEVPPHAWPFIVLPSLLVGIRRYAPATMLAIACGAYVIAGLWAPEGNSILAAPFLAFTVATTRPSRVSARLLTIAALPVSLTPLYGPGDSVVFGVVVVFGVFAVAWIIGVRSRDSQTRAQELELEAVAARAEAEQIAAQAVSDERARIARELHDAVGHAVNVIVMQAGAARLVNADDRTNETLRNIERVGRSALADLDTMLGLLDDGTGSAAPLEPSLRIGDVDDLVERVRAAGMHVTLRREPNDGFPAEVDGPIGSAVYRVVQEALTNAAKHAGRAEVEVVLRSTPTDLVVSVRDDGRGAAAPRPPTGGRGLIGMRERVHVLGGSLDAGPRTGGGFAVEARFPYPKVQP